MFSTQAPDLILLDLGLPDKDGLEIIQYVRKWSQLPIIVVSARDREAEKVHALDLGADDYITKPFGISELMARVRTALRHAKRAPEDSAKDAVQVGELTVDFARRRVTVAEQEIRFTAIEFKIVSLLARHAGKVLTYDYIIKQIWGPHAGADNQILRVNMANIRRKLKEDLTDPRFITTELGVGYRMLED